MNPGEFTRDLSPASTSNCTSAAATGTDGYECYRLVSILAHELGHALSFVDRYTVVRDSAGKVTAITCVDSGGVDIDSVMCNFDNRRARGYYAITPGDVAHFKAVYVPGPVAGVAASNVTASGFDISWDAEDVHVERGVAVLWQPRDGSTNLGDLQVCRSPGRGAWYRARVVGTPTLSGVPPAPVGYDGMTGSATIDLATPSGVDRAYAVVAVTNAVAANAASPNDLEPWRDLDGDKVADEGTIRLCAHDPTLDAPGQKLAASGYAYAYGPVSRGAADGGGSVVFVRTRPIVEISSVGSSLTEGDEARFTVKRYPQTHAGTSTAALTVELSVSESAGMVLGAAPTSVTIPEGADEATVTVRTHNDSSTEQDSEITVAITSDTTYSVSIGSASVTVLDDDDARVAVAAAGSSVPEGESVFFAVSRSGPTTTPLTVEVDVTATGGVVESANLGSRSVTIRAGDSSAAFSAPTLEDDTADGDGAVTATISSGDGYVTDPAGIGGSASVIVVDDDAAPVVLPLVFFSGAAALGGVGGSVVVIEGASADFAVSRSGATASPLTVELEVAASGGVVDSAGLGSRLVTIVRCV